jgi:putative transposase
VRSFIKGLIEAELETALSRLRYGRAARTEADSAAAGLGGHRHGHRSRSLMGTFGPVGISVPRARLTRADGKTSEWKSKTLPAYHRRTRAVDAPERLHGSSKLPH